MTVRNSQTYDNLLLLKDAGNVTVDGAATVGGQARVLDVGLADMGPVKAVVDSSAVDSTTGDETYGVIIQGSLDLAFTTPVTLGRADVTQVGRSEIHFRNNQSGTIYRYIRAFFDVGGTTPILNATIFVARA